MLGYTDIREKKIDVLHCSNKSRFSKYNCGFSSYGDRIAMLQNCNAIISIIKKVCNTYKNFCLHISTMKAICYGRYESTINVEILCF